MNIDKEQLKKNFQEKKWELVFKDAYQISEYLCSKVYKIVDYETKQDYVQECIENFQKKITQNKVDEENNIFSFIYTNSNFRILELLRKERKRREKVRFISYDAIQYSRLKKEQQKAG